MWSTAKQDPSRSFRSSGVAPFGRDLLLVAVILLLVDALAALFLIKVYLPRRKSEALAAAPAQLSLLARDRQNALTGWVHERLGDAEFAARLLRQVPTADPEELLREFQRAYGYTAAYIVDGAGNVLLRLGAPHAGDETPIPGFVRETMKGSGARIDFVRAGTAPKIFTACPIPRPDGVADKAVLFVSNPYDYVYPLFSTFVLASKTGETNLVGLHDGWGTALNPYRGGTPPPMTLRRPIPKDFERRALSLGEQSIRYTDRNSKAVIGVVKAIPRTSWVLVAKIDDDEVFEGAYAETRRLGQLVGVVSILLAIIALAVLRSRRVNELRAAQEQLARLFDHSTTGIIVFRVIADSSGAPGDHEVVGMNPAAEELLGVAATSEVGKRSKDAAYLQWPADVRARNYDVARGGPSIQYEEFNPALRRWAEIRSFSPRDGQFAHLFTDITDRKKSELAIRNLSARLLRVQDDTRRRLARELHDTVGQNLAAVRMNLGVMKRTATADGPDGEIIDDSLAATNDAMSQLRTLSFLLHPPMLDEAGLLTAMQWYIDGFERRGGITTTLNVEGDLGNLPRVVETTVVRIVQESLANIQRHSGSATASVSIHRNERLIVEVADRGRGLPAELRHDRDALLASGVGVAGINERVRELGGELTIHSTAEGTTVRVTLPLAAQD